MTEDLTPANTETAADEAVTEATHVAPKSRDDVLADALREGVIPKDGTEEEKMVVSMAIFFRGERDAVWGLALNAARNHDAGTEDVCRRILFGTDETERTYGLLHLARVEVKASNARAKREAVLAERRSLLGVSAEEAASIRRRRG